MKNLADNKEVSAKVIIAYSIGINRMKEDSSTKNSIKIGCVI
jgi:hypothetical protein